MILGATGSGKSFFLNFLITNLQKYQPLTYIFDLGGSYESLTKLLTEATCASASKIARSRSIRSGYRRQRKISTSYFPSSRS